MAGSPHLQAGFSDGFGSGQVKPLKSYHPFLLLRRISPVIPGTFLGFPFSLCFSLISPSQQVHKSGGEGRAKHCSKSFLILFFLDTQGLCRYMKGNARPEQLSHWCVNLSPPFFGTGGTDLMRLGGRTGRHSRAPMSVDFVCMYHLWRVAPCRIWALASFAAKTRVCRPERMFQRSSCGGGSFRDS
jgi:hypothetical protein